MVAYSVATSTCRSAGSAAGPVSFHMCCSLPISKLFCHGSPGRMRYPVDSTNAIEAKIAYSLVPSTVGGERPQELNSSSPAWQSHDGTPTCSDRWPCLYLKCRPKASCARSRA